MRVAYADPPYPGLAHYYRDHPDYDGEVDHALLLERLGEEYDAWALHTAVGSLRALLPLAPPEARLLAWVKGWASWKPGISPAYAWEPVIICGHRPLPDAVKVRDWFSHHPTTGQGLAGAKPEPVIRWVFAALGLEEGDEVADLYPGTGAVGRAWERYRAEPVLGLQARPAARPDRLEGLEEAEAHG